MVQPAHLAALPRCGAWGRQKQRPCGRIALRGRTRCQLHGGLSFGPPPGSQNGLIHGRRTRAAELERKERVAAARSAREAVKDAVRAADEAVDGFRCDPVEDKP
jgi:hypothetical protein